MEVILESDMYVYVLLSQPWFLDSESRRKLANNVGLSDKKRGNSMSALRFCKESPEHMFWTTSATN